MSRPPLRHYLSNLFIYFLNYQYFEFKKNGTILTVSNVLERNSKQGFVLDRTRDYTLIDPNERNVDLFPDLPERINNIKTS